MTANRLVSEHHRSVRRFIKGSARRTWRLFKDTWILTSFLLALLVAIVASAATSATSLLPSLLGIFGSATVALAIYVFGLTQKRIENTLALHNEFYTHGFAESRRAAEHFYLYHHDQAWGEVNPYDLEDPEDNLKGYSEVLRFWHRVSVLWQQHRLDNQLLASLLAREMGYWMGFIFEPMDTRDDWWTKADIKKLSNEMEYLMPEIYSSGRADGVEKRTKGKVRVFDSKGEKVISIDRDAVTHHRP